MIEIVAFIVFESYGIYLVIGDCKLPAPELGKVSIQILQHRYIDNVHRWRDTLPKESHQL